MILLGCSIHAGSRSGCSRLRAHYRLIDSPGVDQSKLRALLEGVRLLGFSGINVTFPYKEAVVPLLDSLTSAAAAIGAVNSAAA